MKKLLRRMLGVAASALLFCTGSAWAEDSLYIVGGNKWTADATITSETELTTFGSNGYLILKAPVTSTSDLELSCHITYTATSGHDGIGLIETDGIQKLAYLMGSAQGVKCGVAGTMKTGSGMGFDNGSPVVNTEYIAKVTVKNDTWEISYTKVNDTTSVTKKSNKFSTYWNDGSAVFLAIGGTNGGSSMKVKDIKVGTDSVTTLKYNALPSLSLSETTANVEPDATTEITVTAKNAGADVTPTVTSSDESIATASLSGTTLTITGKANGDATITVKNEADPTLILTKTISVTVASYPSTNPAYSLTDSQFAYPKTGTTDAYNNGTLRLTFDDTPTLSESGYISLRKADGTEVDKINFADEVQEAWTGSSINVGSQLVRVEGKNVYIQPHFNKLEGNTKYYIAMPKGAITGKIGGIDFNGFASSIDETNGWSFTTKASATAPADGAEITVSSNESDTPDYRSLNAALYALKNATGKYTIKLAAGDYYELVYYKGKANVKIIGQGSAEYGTDTVIRYINENARNGSTHTRAVFYWGGGSNLVLENLTIKNLTKRGETTTAKDVQAEAIYFANANDSTTYLAKAAFAAFNCTFFSYQDTIHTSGKNWFYKCKISGDVDFIWGEAEVCLVEKCDLTSLYDEKASAHAPAIIAARVSNSSADSVVGKGYVLKDCTITIEEGNTSSFGRQTSSSGVVNYDQAAVIDCIIK